MKVLTVGLVCLDIVHVCKEFPLEDTDQRSLECRLQRGGNAANISTVLSNLGVSSEYFGTFAAGPIYEYLKNDFCKYGIDISNCKIYNDCEFPISSVLINSCNGSRTIVHSNRNLPEPSFSDFEKIDLTNYSWIHFEGRNLVEVNKMMELVEKHNCASDQIMVSVELERPVSELLQLATRADVVFVGKDFSRGNSWLDIETTLAEMKKYVKQSATVICTWGEKGAGVMRDDICKLIAAYIPDKVVDTLGAGDTFCASAIRALLCKQSPEESAVYACRVSGYKVGIVGYDGLKNLGITEIENKDSLIPRVE